MWEYSRLNISNTVLSKRKIEQLINNGSVSGWDDPRLHTIQGLRRRGYTASVINKFCQEIGVSRSGNENLTSFKKLEFYCREELNESAPRTFAVLNPIELEIVNFDELAEKQVEACYFPPDKTKGVQILNVTKSVYVDVNDFSAEEKKGFFGLMPGQVVLLRYGPHIQMEEVVKNSAGKVEKVRVRIIANHTAKVKGVIHWVSKDHSIPAIINQYSNLLTVENVAVESKKDNRDWTSYFNKDSLVVYRNARMWNM